MSSYKRKRRFIIESTTDGSGIGDQLLVNKKCRRVVASDTEDSSEDENLHQSHPLIRRSPWSLEDEDGGSGPHLLYIETEPDSPRFSFVQEETARRQERPINYYILRDLSSPTSKYVTSFQKNKEKLTRRLYKFFNRTVFENQLPADMEISWNKRLRRKAGRTGYRKKNGERRTIIQLADKICDSADRLRDTLIHEMCHAAGWVIDGNTEFGHNQLWRQYCEKVAQIHPDLPPITVSTKWKIHYPVIYQCSGCQNRVKRWTNSLNTEKYVCGSCENKFVLVTQN
ncbi:germ cell nuclear acidic protein-like [Anomaloglossus baeobatrachus]|uniref:germ cell nuclear acidic protein-like n=1 Tax=Anomaloglossus baeobatrachus TaxID=238106 RepID=UPI003F503B8D